MRFLACHDFHTYNSHRLACGFRIVTTSARTSCAGVHALSRLSQFLQVPFLPGYMRFPDCHIFRMYRFRGKTCAFALIMPFACTISVGVHALFGSSRFPHILVTPAYMHFSACHVFRTYYFRGKTCAFGLSRFPHVLFPREDMRFRACHNFCTYNFHGLACGFGLASLSAHTIPAGVHALSRLSCLSHVLFLSGYMRFRAYPIFRTY